MLCSHFLTLMHVDTFRSQREPFYQSPGGVFSLKGRKYLSRSVPADTGEEVNARTSAGFFTGVQQSAAETAASGQHETVRKGHVLGRLMAKIRNISSQYSTYPTIQSTANPFGYTFKRYSESHGFFLHLPLRPGPSRHPLSPRKF